ncbi:MAG: vWA domain-containing protein [Coriobacteriales bacterium]|nr:vWA domain-containing protein [Coriobacteriales bacterium]
MENNLTELVFVIDRSGSMGGLESDTIGGVNSVLAENRQIDGEAYVTTVLFDHEIMYLHDHVDLREVTDLTRKDYQVRGCTALLDAVADAIKHTDRVQGYLPKPFRAKKVIVTVVTDGLENASKRYSYTQVKSLIEEKTAQGWDFLFLGANIDVAAEADRLGIARENAAPYLADSMGTSVAYEAVACAQRMSRTKGHVDKSWAAGVRADHAKRR